MSDVTRYSDLQVWETLHFGGSTNGWVRFEDYARLQAEVERLRNLGIKLDGYVDLVRHENERLIKAGDELSWAFAFAVSRDDGKESGLIKAWNAAKEGSQP